MFNWGLARVKAALSQREAEQSYGLTGDLLTPVPWTLPALRLAWNAAKNEAAPWWSECSKEAYSSGLDQLARGLKNFTDSRPGKRAGFPRFKKRGKARDSFRYTTPASTARPAIYRRSCPASAGSRSTRRWACSPATAT
ncbi:hypothetical protein MXD62_21520 [Frankia sp. Mgl5]|uniref:hypothetical protein n=1 Tax=Frankia sp. Mgl5 TaxID=2933793 RepID=UPI00200F913D|nr:hypothetical protein [Frankia sp. Mgl5]MCK9929719.1 hypothetical protein [Frankia sp. Mgl5]